MDKSGPPETPPKLHQPLEAFNASEDIARALMALDAGQIGSWSQDVRADQVWGDRITTDLFSFDFNNQPWTTQDFFAAIHPEEVDRIRQAVDDVLQGVTSMYDVEMRLKPKTETAPPRWVGARARVTEWDDKGNALRLIGVVWDISEPKYHQHQLSLLAAEMDHRVKNAFAVIRALINIGAASSTSTESFANTLRSQVEAMATAHTLSARMARSTNDANARVSLTEVIETTLSPWLDGRDTDQAAVINVDIAEDIMLPPAKIAAVAMFLYELSTNATKYGPLGELRGTLSISVQTNDDGVVDLLWKETLAVPFGTPPQPSKDQRGFGDILLNHCAGNLNAKLSREMTKEGLWVKLRMTKEALG